MREKYHYGHTDYHDEERHPCDTPNQAHDMGYPSRTDQIADQGIGSSR